MASERVDKIMGCQEKGFPEEKQISRERDAKKVDTEVTFVPTGSPFSFPGVLPLGNYRGPACPGSNPVVYKR